jgi:hypothetical protein
LQYLLHALAAHFLQKLLEAVGLWKNEHDKWAVGGDMHIACSSATSLRAPRQASANTKDERQQVPHGSVGGDQTLKPRARSVVSRLVFGLQILEEFANFQDQLPASAA